MGSELFVSVPVVGDFKSIIKLEELSSSPFTALMGSLTALWFRSSASSGSSSWMAVAVYSSPISHPIDKNRQSTSSNMPAATESTTARGVALLAVWGCSLMSRCRHSDNWNPINELECTCRSSFRQLRTALIWLLWCTATRQTHPWR